MLIQIGIFIVSLSVLLYASRIFTNAAEKIGLLLGLSPFMIGLVIVSVGTSLPELISGIIATNAGKSEIAAGNVLGANVSNLLLLLGITTLASKKTIELGETYIFIDLHFMLGSTLMIGLFLWDGTLTWKEGVLLLVGFILYQIHLLKSEKVVEKEKQDKADSKEKIKQVGIMALAGIGVFLGADYTITSIISISTSLEINEAIISATVLSLGTTLPELAVSYSAAKAGKAQIAIGNILGSCIFNSLLVLGTSSLFGEITLPENMRAFSIIFVIGSAVFFYLLSQDKKINKFEGLLFILFYFTFILKIIGVV
jgi:cation:H+ antiporter